MQPVSLSCPNCGGGLGPMQGGQYVCAYCGHRSVPAASAFDAQQRAATLERALAEFDARRTRARSRIAELKQREHDALAQGRRVNGYVMLGIGGLFLLFALGCFVGAGVTLVAAGEAVGAAGIGGFGLFWLALGGGLFYIGVRYMRSDRRDRRLRERGLRGRAVVVSYLETSLRVDGDTRFHLVLRVELPGRPPYDVRQTDNVPSPGAVTTGADLPVFVDPGNTNDVMVDWFAMD